jgi:hypothetical protein
VKYLDLQKSWRVFLRDLPSNIDEIRARLQIFTASPQNKKTLEESIGLDVSKDEEKILALLLNPESRSHIQKQKISLSIDILTGGEEAFAIRNTDKTDTGAYKAGKWLQKHSILSTIATGIGIGASSILA